MSRHPCFRSVDVFFEIDEVREGTQSLVVGDRAYLQVERGVLVQHKDAVLVLLEGGQRADVVHAALYRVLHIGSLLFAGDQYQNLKHTNGTSCGHGGMGAWGTYMVPVWSNCTSQKHCKWQTKSYLTTPISYTTITTFSPLEGGTECQQ